MSINANSLSITDALVDFLRESGLEQTVMDRQIEEVWPQVMGETVQQLTRSVEVKDGMLYVRVNSAALKAQLFENRFELVRKLNEAVGAPAISGDSCVPVALMKNSSQAMLLIMKNSANGLNVSEKQSVTHYSTGATWNYRDISDTMDI